MKTLISSILLMSLVISCSDSDEAPCTKDAIYCSMIVDGDMDDTLPVIDAHLKTLTGTSSQKLKGLVQWLDCQTCVLSPKVLCDSCLESAPPQSEVGLTIKNGDTQTEYILRVLMSDTLQALSYKQK